MGVFCSGSDDDEDAEAKVLRLGKAQPSSGLSATQLNGHLPAPESRARINVRAPRVSGTAGGSGGGGDDHTDTGRLFTSSTRIPISGTVQSAVRAAGVSAPEASVQRSTRGNTQQQRQQQQASAEARDYLFDGSVAEPAVKSHASSGGVSVGPASAASVRQTDHSPVASEAAFIAAKKFSGVNTSS